MTGVPPSLDELLAHAGWLHRLAQQLARDHASGADAAQDVLLARLPNAAAAARGGNLRDYLAGALRNLLRLQRRSRQRNERREQLHGGERASFAASAADVAARAELHQLLGRCVLELPEPQRAFVLLHYFEGVTVAAIAARADATPDAVRAHLRRARDTLRSRLGTDSDQRSRAAFAAIAAGHLTTASLTIMTTKVLPAVAAAAVLLFWWAPWRTAASGFGAAPPTPSAARAHAQLVADQEVAPIADGAVASTAPPAPPRLPHPPVATGTLHVRARWSSGMPAAGARLVVQPMLGQRSLELECFADANGEARIAGLPGGTGQVCLDHRGGERFTLRAGETTFVDLQLRAGVFVRGLVVDANAAPIGGARIWLSRPGTAEEGLDVGAAAPDGTFVVPDLAPGSFLAAFAPGRLRSHLVRVARRAGEEHEVRIVLDQPGIAIVGRVLGPDGQPAVGARVLAGRCESRLPWHRESVWSVARPPIETRCDEHGAFRIEGQTPGEPVPLWARAADSAPQRHLLSLPAAGEARLDLVLARGATVRGRATGVAGEALPGVGVTVEATALAEPHATERPDAAPDWVETRAIASSDGSYELRHVAAGPARLLASRDEPRQTAEAGAVLRDGEVSMWDPVLTSGITVRGTVVDDTNAPLADWRIEAHGEGPDDDRRATTDAHGAFELPDCGNADYQLALHGPGGFSKLPAAWALDVRASTQDLRIVVPRDRVPSATITGRVTFAPGLAASPVLCWIWSDAARTAEVVPDLFANSFRLGHLAPGVYRIRADNGTLRTAWSEPIELRADETIDVGVLTFGPTGLADLQIVDGNGSMLDGVLCLVVETIGDVDLIVGGGHTRHGALGLAGLRPGSYRLRVAMRDQPMFDTPFAVAAGERSEVRIVVPDSVACTLRAEPARRAGKQDFVVRWQRDGDAPMQERMSMGPREPREIARRFVPGDWRVTFRNRAGAESTTRFVIRAGDEAPRVTVRLP